MVKARGGGMARMKPTKNVLMAEVEKAIVEETETPETEEVNIELESNSTDTPSMADVAEGCR